MNQSSLNDTINMNTKMNRYLIENLLLWVALYLFWIFIFQNHTLTLIRTLTVEFCYLIFIALCYYLQVLILLPRFLSANKFWLYIQFTALSLALSAWQRAKVALFITTSYFHAPDPIDFTNLYLNSLLNIFIWTALLTGAHLLIERNRTQKRINAIQKEKMETELKFLKAQNNPHFLFNSLNSIYFQIDKNNKDARETLMKFSEMLRYQLYECNVDRIDIEKEIKYLAAYVELQRLRMNDNYEIILNAPDKIKGFQIAPLLLIPLVENAFKYVSHQTDGLNQIQINLSYQDNRFQYQVMNTKEKIQQPHPTTEAGIGLKNVQRRLELLYPNIHTLNIQDTESSFTVILALKNL